MNVILRGGYVEDESGAKWWSAELLAKVERERDEARAQLENVLDAHGEGGWMARALDAERERDEARVRAEENRDHWRVALATLQRERDGARAEARVSGRLCDLLENSRDIAEKDAFAAIGKVRILERERDEARAEVARLQALLEQVQADAERINSRNFILREEIAQLQPAEENEALRCALAVRTMQCANHQSRADRLANEVRTVAERQREATLRSVFFKLKAALGAGKQQQDLAAVIDAEREMPLVTEAKE